VNDSLVQVIKVSVFQKRSLVPGDKGREIGVKEVFAGMR
jgi:hypothetical protein